MNLNKAFILGRLTRDPQSRSLPSGQQVTNFSVATNKIYTDKEGQRQEKAEFHNVVAFGKQAEIAGQYLKQGSSVLVEGRIQTRSWEDQSGVKKYMTEIVVDSLQLGPKKQGTYQSQEHNSQSSESKEEKINNFQKKEEKIKEEEIPTIEEEEEIDVKDLPL